jgi:ubiquinone/menaquinone biosynthesis C-methylase UbiE
VTPNSFDDEVDDYYKKYYAKVHSNGSLGFAHKIMHSKLELNRKSAFQKVLELGCGNFEHYSFISHDYDFYTATDLRNPPKSYVEKFLRSHQGNSFQIANATDLPFPQNSFDRVVVGCLIVHLVDVKQAIHEWQRVTKKDGVIDFVIPCDPGILSRIFRRLVSVPNARKYGVSRETYQKINAYEHVSLFPRTWTILQSEIEPNRKMKIRYFPFPFLRSWNLNAFAVISIQGTEF